MQQVFITGGTGYIGSRLINLLLQKNYAVTALVRPGSQTKLPPGCAHIVANPFDSATFAAAIPVGATFIQLLGVAHPSPQKKEQFQTIDLASAEASAIAAATAKASHIVYISVAQTPISIMRSYQLCRAAGEAAIAKTGIPATFIRPWYVIGPGHYWPLLLAPFLKLFELFPATASKARAMRLVSLKQLLKALVFAVENPPKQGVNIVEIDQIKNFSPAHNFFCKQFSKA